MVYQGFSQSFRDKIPPIFHPFFHAQILHTNLCLIFRRKYTCTCERAYYTDLFLLSNTNNYFLLYSRGPEVLPPHFCALNILLDWHSQPALMN